MGEPNTTDYSDPTGGQQDQSQATTDTHMHVDIPGAGVVSLPKSLGDDVHPIAQAIHEHYATQPSPAGMANQELAQHGLSVAPLKSGVKLEDVSAAERHLVSAVNKLPAMTPDERASTMEAWTKKHPDVTLKNGMTIPSIDPKPSLGEPGDVPKQIADIGKQLGEGDYGGVASTVLQQVAMAKAMHKAGLPDRQAVQVEGVDGHILVDPAKANDVSRIVHTKMNTKTTEEFWDKLHADTLAGKRDAEFDPNAPPREPEKPAPKQVMKPAPDFGTDKEAWSNEIDKLRSTASQGAEVEPAPKSKVNEGLTPENANFSNEEIARGERKERYITLSKGGNITAHMSQPDGASDLKGGVILKHTPDGKIEVQRGDSSLLDKYRDRVNEAIKPAKADPMAIIKKAGLTGRLVSDDPKSPIMIEHPNRAGQGHQLTLSQNDITNPEQVKKAMAAKLKQYDAAKKRLGGA